MTRFVSFLLVLGLVTGARAAGADLAKLDPRARVALARLRAGESPAKLGAGRAAVTAEGELDVFVVGPVSRAALEAAGAHVRTEAGGVFTVSIPPRAIAAVAALSGVRRIEGSAPVMPTLDVSIPAVNVNHARGPGPAFAGLNGQGVLVGAVDTGVDYHHDDFKDAAGQTRLIGVWDQEDHGGPTPQTNGTGPFTYGSDWTPATLDNGTAREADRYPHGTHVLGIAGGDGSGTGGTVPAFTYAGVAPRADLVMVKTNFQTTGIMDGVSYIFQRATARGENAVVNLSLGGQFGPHDGTSAFETGLNALTGPGHIIATAAGNDRGRGFHGKVNAAGAGTNAAVFVGASALNQVVAIDGYYESTENLSLTITTPNGTVIGPLTRGSMNTPYPGLSTPNGFVYVENGASLSGGGDPEVYLEVNTMTAGQNMSGSWTFTFVPVTLGAANGLVDLWVAFADTWAVFTTGNWQDQLVIEPGNADSLITVAAWLTKRTWIDCAGHAVEDGSQPLSTLAGFSSPGPTRTGGHKPDITAPGVDIASTLSFDVNPVCPPGQSTFINDGPQHVIDAGTSMSTPHVAGVVALLMQKYGAISPSFAKAYLNAHAAVDANTGPTWNKDWGSGKLFVGDLTDPTAQVLFPNVSNDSLGVGTTRNLTWSAVDPYQGVTAVDLYLSRDDGANYQPLALGVPNTGSYSWVVTGPTTSQARLRVLARDAAGNQGQDASDQAWPITFSITDIEPLPGNATAFSLALSPNPSPGTTAVDFALPHESDVLVTVHDLQGRKIAELVHAHFPAGRYRRTWRDASIASGLYWVRYRAPGFDRVQRLAIAR